MTNSKKLNYKKISVALSFAAFNLIIGAFVAFFKLPIYLDSIGIILSTILLGWEYGVLCAILTVSAGFLLINPYLPFYFFTSLGVVAVTHFSRKLNLFSSSFKVVLFGISLAICSAILSAPVTAYLFEGSTLSGSDALTAYFISTGNNILKSVLLSGLSSEPVDKVLVAIISYIILKSIPKSFIEAQKFNHYNTK